MGVVSDAIGFIIPPVGKAMKAAEQAEQLASKQRASLEAAESKQAAAVATEQKKLSEQQSRANRSRRAGGLFDSGDSGVTEVVTQTSETLG